MSRSLVRLQHGPIIKNANLRESNANSREFISDNSRLISDNSRYEKIRNYRAYCGYRH